MQGSYSISQPKPYACQLTNPKATGEDHKRAAKTTLNFAGRTVATAIHNQIRLVFNITGTVGGAVGGVLGAAGGLIKGCYQKAVYSGSDAAKKPLTDFMIKAARTGYMKGDHAGRWAALATLPIHGAFAIIGGGIGGGIVAATTAPIVYLQARDNSAGHSEMADYIEDNYSRPNDLFDEMNNIIQTGETKLTRREREERNLYGNSDLSYDFTLLYQMEERVRVDNPV